MIMTECRACEATVPAETLAHYSAVLDPKLGTTERITFARCPKCNSPLLVGEELYRNDGGREIWSDPYRLYPQHDDTFGPRIPRVVGKCYDEALSCFRARAYSAAAMMCRRTLQAASIERHIHQPTLALSLADMRSQGTIEPKMLEWAEAMTHVTDEAPPLDADVSHEDAREVLEFTDAFLAYLYTFRKGFHEFRKRRDNKVAERPPVASEPTALAAAAAASSRPSNGDQPI